MSDDAEGKWLADLNMVRERLEGRAHAIEDLSVTFARIGNDLVAKELALSVQVLRECAGTVFRTSGILCNMMVKQATEASNNMLSAALAGAELAGRSRTHCPMCNSKDRTKHPAMAEGGEVQPCLDPWHGETAEGRKTLALVAHLIKPARRGM